MSTTLHKGIWPRWTRARSARIISWAAEGIARVTGKEPFLTADALRMSRYRMFFSSEKAKRELGYAARPYQEGLKDALNWFRDNGYLK